MELAGRQLRRPDYVLNKKKKKIKRTSIMCATLVHSPDHDLLTSCFTAVLNLWTEREIRHVKTQKGLQDPKGMYFPRR